MIGVDRLDYSKGLIQRMEAFERFYALIRNGKTRSPICRSRRRADRRFPNIPSSTGGRRRSGRINGLYGEVAWTPIRYLNRTFSRSSLAGLYRVGARRSGHAAPRRHESRGERICLGTGCRRSRRADLVAICRRCGDAKRALLVNPYDPSSRGRAIARALDMPQAERRERHRAIFEALTHNPIILWSTNFLHSLEPSAGVVAIPREPKALRNFRAREVDPKRIRITNDDGIDAPGLAVLEQIASDLTDDVWVVAPETDNSGASHSLTLAEPLRMRGLDKRHYAVRGTPTDCVIMGVRFLLSRTKPPKSRSVRR